MPKFNIADRLRSFTHAWRGLRVALLSEHNLWIHLAAATAVIAAGFYFEFTRVEWCLLILTIAIVIGLELVNTAIEALADRVTKEQDPLIAKAKDVAAAAVLVAAIAAVFVGLLVFL